MGMPAILSNEALTFGKQDFIDRKLQVENQRVFESPYASALDSHLAKVDPRLANEKPEYIYANAQKTSKGYNLGTATNQNKYYQMKSLEDVKEYQESKTLNNNFNSEYVTHLKSKQA